MDFSMQRTDWGWSRGAALLLRIAKLAITAAVVVTVGLLYRRTLDWRLLLVFWGLAAVMTWAGLWWRRADRVRRQANRDARAAPSNKIDGGLAQDSAASELSSGLEAATEPKMPPCALIMASPASWNCGK